MKEFLLNVWDAYKKLDVAWQTLIFTGIWTGLWKIVYKLPKWFSVLWLWLNRKFLYRFHPIECYQFVGCIHKSGSIVSFPSIFDYATMEDLEKCVSKKHKGQVKDLTSKGVDNAEVRTHFYEKLSFVEKCRLHKVYVNVYKDHERKQEQQINDFERNYYGPLKKFI